MFNNTIKELLVLDLRCFYFSNLITLFYEYNQPSIIQSTWQSIVDRYNNGALTSSDAQIVSYAGAQIKKTMEIAHKLGAESFLFRGVKEGYSSSLNADHTRELRNYARLLKMAAGT